MVAPGGIVWLASFPKSGNTWFRIFLANLSAQRITPADINDLDERGGIASSRHEFEAATMLDSSLLSHDEIDRLRPRVFEAIVREAGEQRWIKAHDAYADTPDGEPLFGRNTARAAVYLVRDPRDVAISLSHHNGITIDAAIAFMNAGGGELRSSHKGIGLQLRQKILDWSGHVASWLDQTDVPVHLVRYEDLRTDPIACFSAALAFAGRNATPEDIERAVRHSDFSELRRQEDEKGFKERRSREPFFRAGQVGGWRETLTATQVRTIENRHSTTMARLGYDSSSP